MGQRCLLESPLLIMLRDGRLVQLPSIMITSRRTRDFEIIVW